MANRSPVGLAFLIEHLGLKVPRPTDAEIAQMEEAAMGATAEGQEPIPGLE